MNHKKMFTINWRTKDPVLSKKLTVFGSLTLLLAFILQTYLYNEWNDRLKLYEQANRDYTEMTRESLEYQNLFLNLKSQNDSIRETFEPLFIRAAAEKYRTGRIISTNLDLFENRKDVEQSIYNSNKMLYSVEKVRDFLSLYQFVNEVERHLPKNQKLENEWVDKISKRKEIASYLFAFLQIVGSLMVAIGFKYQ